MTQGVRDEGSMQAGITSWLASIRRVPGWFLAFMLVVFFSLAVITNHYATLGDYLGPLSRDTGYLLHPTLLNYLPYFLVLGLLWWKVGKLRWQDLGMYRSKLPAALAWVLGTWVLAQIAFLSVHWGDTTVDIPGGIEASVEIGSLLGQLLGNALCEEIFWRAFVLSQFLLLFQHRWNWRYSRAIAGSILASSALFALSHIPHDLAQGEALLEICSGQLGRVLAGIAFAGIFLLSNNLFMAVGLHSLVNVPMSVFQRGDSEFMRSLVSMGPLLILLVLALRRGRQSIR